MYIEKGNSNHSFTLIHAVNILICQRVRRGKFTPFTKISFSRTIPVLFIPGSQGHPKQVRSIASTAFEIPLVHSLNYTFEFFSLDFSQVFYSFGNAAPRIPQHCPLKWSSARQVLHKYSLGSSLLECVANVIPFVHGLFAKAPVPMTIVGHSMVGCHSLQFNKVLSVLSKVWVKYGLLMNDL